jgi:hypothetical protein
LRADQREWLALRLTIEKAPRACQKISEVTGTDGLASARRVAKIEVLELRPSTGLRSRVIVARDIVAMK